MNTCNNLFTQFCNEVCANRNERKHYTGKYCPNCDVLHFVDWATRFIVHPGETLREALANRSITPDDLANRVGFSRAHIAQVLRSERDIGLPLAVQLEFILGVPVTFWLNLQAQYDEELLTACC